MHVRRVPCQEHTPDAVTIDHSHCRPIKRTPRYPFDAMACDLVHRAFDIRYDSLRFAGQLEQCRVWQRAERHHPVSGEGPEMPVAAVESSDFDVGYQQGLLVDRLALELEAKRFSNYAVAAIASDQEVRFHPFTGRQGGVHAVLILGESDERLAELDLAAEPAQTLAQDGFRARLWHHPQVWVRHALGRLLEWSERARSQREGAEMGLEFRVKRTSRENCVDDAEIIQDFEGARLKALAARPREGRGGGLNQTKGDLAAGEINGQR